MKMVASGAALAWRWLWSQPLAAVLNLVLLGLGLAIITLVLLVQAQLQRAFERDLAGIDAVVGAKGSPLQLILAGVFHIDVPPGNVPLAEIEALRRHPQVAQLIPLSLGDNLDGFRIVGTSHDYPALYGAQLAAGRLWQRPMEAVLGAQAARATGLTEGRRFIGLHGLGVGGHAHGESPYTVVGRLAPCGCVLDRLILTDTESVWLVHEQDMAVDEADRQALMAEREITLALVRYATPLAAVSFPRWVNATTTLQAAAPALEVARLLRLLGTGLELVQALAGVLLLTAALGVFIALWNSVRARRSDLALLRLLGATPGRIGRWLALEALWLAGLASLLGLALGHGLTGLLGWMLAAERSLPLTGWTFEPVELAVPLLAVAVALLAAALPVRAVYRAELAHALTER